MKIVLDNFKCHKHIEIDFSANKTLLVGKSGIGKSTIVESIRYVLYGHLKSMGKCRVTLTIGDMEIVRTSSPSSITVSIGDNTYHKDEAQSIINDRFGDEDVFLCKSYIPQLSMHRFLELDNNGRLALINQILDNSRVSTIKSRVKDIITATKSKIDDIDKEIYSLSNVVDHISNQLSDYKPELYTDDIDDVIQSYKDEKEDLSIELEDAIKNNTTIKIHNKRREELVTSKNKLSNNARDTTEELEDLQEKINSVQVSRITRSELIKNIENDMMNLGDISKYMDESEITKLLNDKKLNEELSVICKTINIPTIQDLREFDMDAKLSKYNEDYDNMKKSIDAIEHNKRCKTPLECPHCNNKVIYIGGSLSMDFIEPVDVPVPNADNKKLMELDRKIIMFTKIKEKVSQLLPTFTADTLLPSSYFDDIITKFNKYKELYRQLEDIRLKSIHEEITEEEYDELLDNKKDLETLLNNHKKLSIIEEELSFVVDKLDSLELKDIRSIQEKIEERIFGVEMFEKTKQQHKNFVELEEKQKQIDKLQSDKSKLDKFLTDVEFIKSKIVIAEPLYLKTFIDSINDRLQYHMSQLFTSITANITTSKMLKNKSEKPMIHITIHNNGEEYTVNDLSGGEKSRLSICLLLSFSDVLQSDFLILDESMNALDIETKEEVIEHLQSKKLILISHDDFISHAFDKVITL